MAEETVTGAVTDPAPPPEGNPPEPEGDEAAIAAQAKDPDAVTKALRSERASAREARKKAEALEVKVKEFEDRDKSEQEKANQRLVEAEKKARDAETKLLRLEVAAEKKLPTELAARLAGETKEELEADAETLLNLVKADNTPSFDGGARASTNTSNDMNARIRAAAGR